jgi:hypothetical protein
MTQKDYSKNLTAMVKRWHELDEERKKIVTVALAVIKEQRKLPGENNAKFVKYCTDLFVHNAAPCTQETFELLSRRSQLLAALECGGVDSWQGYHEATKDFYKDVLDD